MMNLMTLIVCGSLLVDAPAESKPISRPTRSIPSVEIKSESAAPLIVPRGVDAVQYFTVTNRRSVPIEPSLAPGLGLHALRSHEARAIAAGDSAKYAVFFKSRPHGGGTDRRLALWVENQDEWLQWHFYVRRDVVCHPSRFSLGDVESGTDARSICTLQAIVGRDWTITSAESKRGAVTITATETLRKPADKDLVRVDFEVTAKLDATASPGPVDDVVVLHTTDREMPEIWLLCEGTVVVPKGE